MGTCIIAEASIDLPAGMLSGIPEMSTAAAAGSATAIAAKPAPFTAAGEATAVRTLEGRGGGAIRRSEVELDAHGGGSRARVGHSW